MNKTVDLSTIKFPDEMRKMDKETPFFSKWINKISTKRKKNKRLFIITDWEFFVLKKKTFSKKLILSYSFRWYDITSIDYDDEKKEEFTIRFKKNKNKKKKKQTIQSIQNEYSKTRDYFTFKYPKAEKMLKMLYTYLNSFHLPDELPKFNFPEDFPFPNAKGSIPDHMRMKLRLNNHRISTTTLNTLKKFISSEPTEFNFTEIRGIINSLPIFLECIDLAPSINTLVIPFDVNFDSLKILIDFLPDNENITSLVFKDKLPENFSSFKDAFLSMSSTENIDSFKFINSKFTKQNVDDISAIVRNRTIKTLQLKNSLGPLTLKPFIQDIYSNTGYQSITNFTLDHTQSIDIRTLMPYLKNVTTLTLIHCEFEIADLFDVLTADYSMTSLNASQNNNDKQIFNSILFPRHLSSIILKDIKWELLSLSNFIESVMKHRPISNKEEIGDNQIKLDLSQLKMSDDDWSLFFSQIEEKPRGSIISLGWDDNPIDWRFINFINSFISLSSLSLNGCIIRQKIDFESLLKFIADSTSLTALSIHGTELQNLGKNILAVIDTLYINRSIRRLDINNHECGNDILLKLADVLLQNRVVDEISFCTRNSINDISLFELFFIVLGKNRGKPLVTEFPSSFTKSARQFGAISDDQFSKLKNDYNEMIIGNKKVKIPPLTVQRSNKKFVFKNYVDNPGSIDYDEGARIRRSQIEKKYKLMAKKVELPSSSNLVDVDENDHKKDAENEYDAEDDIDAENIDETLTTKNATKKRKRRKSMKKSKAKQAKQKVDDDDIEPLNHEEKSHESIINDPDESKNIDEKSHKSTEDDFSLHFDDDENVEIEAAEMSETNPAEMSETNPAEMSETNPAEMSETNPAEMSETNPAEKKNTNKKSKKQTNKEEDLSTLQPDLTDDELGDDLSPKEPEIADLDAEDEEKEKQKSPQKMNKKKKNKKEEKEETQKKFEDEGDENSLTRSVDSINAELNNLAPSGELNSKKKMNKNSKKTAKSPEDELNESSILVHSNDDFDFDIDADFSSSLNKKKQTKKNKKEDDDFIPLDDGRDENPLARSIDELNAELSNLALSNELENENKDEVQNDLEGYEVSKESEDEIPIPIPPKEPEFQDEENKKRKTDDVKSDLEGYEVSNESENEIPIPIPPKEPEFQDDEGEKQNTEEIKNDLEGYEVSNESENEIPMPVPPKEPEFQDDEGETQNTDDEKNDLEGYEVSNESEDKISMPDTNEAQEEESRSSSYDEEDGYEESSEPQTMLPSDIENFEQDDEVLDDDKGSKNDDEMMPEAKYEDNEELDNEYENDSSNEFVF